MPATAALLDPLRDLSLLEPEQLEELAQLDPGRFADNKALAKELLQRGWLTAYQANLLLQGKARELVLGSYVLLEKLGEGGMGAVFKARHQTLGRVVALKLIRKDRISSAATVKRFQREIRAAAQLNHPNIVLAFDADEANGNHFFTMEFVPGTDLSQLVKKDGPLPVAHACDYIRQAALGLEHALHSGMVHRDIKPHNLLLQASRDRQGAVEAASLPDGRGSFGVVKILDMGLARVASSEGEATSMLTQEGVIMGTPDFIAPEQAQEAHDVDIRADLYSLGCTMYFLLTGQVPFPGGSLTSKLMRHQMDEAKPVEQLRPEVPPAVGAIVRKLLAKKPADRYQTPGELAKALAAVASGQASGGNQPVVGASHRGANAPRSPVTAPMAETMHTPDTHTRPRPARPQRRQADRKRLVLFNAIGGGVLLVVGVVLFILLRSTKPDRPESPPAQAVVPRPPVQPLGPGFHLPAESWPDRPPELAFVIGEERGRHWGWAMAVAFSPDGKVLATGNGGVDNKVRFWDPVTLEEKLRLVDSAYTTTMAFSPDGKQLATAYNPPQLWDLAGPVPLLRSEVPRGGAIVGFTADSRYLVMRSDKGVVLVDTATFPQPPPVTLHEFTVAGVSYATLSHDGRILAAFGNGEQEVRILDLSNPRQPRIKATVPVQKPGDIALSPDGKQLAVTSGTTTVQLWDLSGPEPKGPIAEETMPTNAVTGLAYSPDGKRLARGRSTVGYQLIDVSGGKLDSTGLPYLKDGAVPIFSPDGRMVVLRFGNMLIPWDVSGPEPKQTLPPSPTGSLIGMGLSRDGQTLAVFSGGTFAVWDVPSRQLRGSSHTNFRDSMSLHPDGKFLVTTGNNQVVYYDTATCTLMKAVSIPGSLKYSTFSPDGSLLAVNDVTGNVRVLDGTTGEEKQKLQSTPGPVAFSADGKLLAASSKVFDLATGKEQCTLAGTGWMAFRPDGKMIATSGGGSQGSIHLCDTASGKLLRQVRPWGSCVAFSPDGRFLARSSGNGNTIHLFDPDSGAELKVITMPGPSAQVQFTADGQYLVTANANGTAYFLRVSSPSAP